MKWFDIPSAPLYQLNEKGQIRSIRRKGYILKQRLNSWGYPSVGLTINGKKKHKMVHVLIAEVFIGLCPHNKEVNHKDGNKMNYTVSNLEYITHKENMQHSWDIGIHKPMYGTDNGRSKLTPKDVKHIRNLHYIEGVSMNRISKIYGMSYSSIRSAIRGES